MNQQGLERVAHARALDLRVEHDGLGHLQIRTRVDEDVHESPIVLEDGHARVLGDPPHEGLTASGNDEIDEIGQLQHGADGGAVGDVDELDGLGRRARLLHGLGEHGGEHGVRLDRLAAAAQDDGVARLQAQPHGVGRHVRARLVDEPDDAERHADA